MVKHIKRARKAARNRQVNPISMNSKFPQTVSLVDGKLAPNPEGKAGKKESLSVRNPHGSGIRKGSGKQDRKKVSSHAPSSSRLQEYGGTCGRRLRVENYDVTSDKLQRKEFSFQLFVLSPLFPCFAYISCGGQRRTCPNENKSIFVTEGDQDGR